MVSKLKIDRVKNIYREIPEGFCQGKCFETCGPIFMSNIEKSIIIEFLGHDPFFTPEYIIANADNLACLTCPLLVDNRCSIYDIRPLICRLYGAVENLKCSFGCKPKRFLTHKESVKLIKKLHRIK